MSKDNPRTRQDPPPPTLLEDLEDLDICIITEDLEDEDIWILKEDLAYLDIWTFTEDLEDLNIWILTIFVWLGLLRGPARGSPPLPPWQI